MVKSFNTPTKLIAIGALTTLFRRNTGFKGYKKDSIGLKGLWRMIILSAGTFYSPVVCHPRAALILW